MTTDAIGQKPGRPRKPVSATSTHAPEVFGGRPESMRVTRAEFARLCQVSKQAVSEWVKKGTITIGPDGLLDPIKASAEVLRNSDPARLRARIFKTVAKDTTDLIERNRQLEARVKQLEARTAELEAELEAEIADAYQRGKNAQADTAAEKSKKLLDIIATRYGLDPDHLDIIEFFEIYGFPVEDALEWWTPDTLAAAGYPVPDPATTPPPAPPAPPTPKHHDPHDDELLAGGDVSLPPCSGHHDPHDDELLAGLAEAEAAAGLYDLDLPDLPDLPPL